MNLIKLASNLVSQEEPRCMGNTWVQQLSFLISIHLNLQEAEAKAAAAEERERALNERLSQSLSRITILETQVLFALSTFFICKSVGAKH